MDLTNQFRSSDSTGVALRSDERAKAENGASKWL